MTQRNSFTQAPGEELDYQIDYTSWLGTDTIASSSWTTPPNIHQPQSATNDQKTTTIWLSGTREDAHEIQNKIVTAGGRTKIQTFVLLIRAS